MHILVNKNLRFLNKIQNISNSQIWVKIHDFLSRETLAYSKNKKEYTQGIVHADTVVGYFGLLKRGVKRQWIQSGRRWLLAGLQQSGCSIGRRNWAHLDFRE
jgi:hypothetical protein